MRILGGGEGEALVCSFWDARYAGNEVIEGVFFLYWRWALDAERVRITQ